MATVSEKTSPTPARTAKPRKRKVSAFWTKQLHTWHWMSSAICLVGMLLFAVTGITLNHAADIAAEPVVTTREATLPAPLLAMLKGSGEQPAPSAVVEWAEKTVGADLNDRPAEWNDDEVYIALKRPGGDGWLSIDRADGAVTYERTDRGWIAYLNDLHKGRDTGTAWRWFLDVFAVACIIFCVTGFFLLQLHAAKRKSTWPIVGAGVIAPLLLILLFMHS